MKSYLNDVNIIAFSAVFCAFGDTVASNENLKHDVICRRGTVAPSSATLPESGRFSIEASSDVYEPGTHSKGNDFKDRI